MFIRVLILKYIKLGHSRYCQLTQHKIPTAQALIARFRFQAIQGFQYKKPQGPNMAVQIYWKLYFTAFKSFTCYDFRMAATNLY